MAKYEWLASNSGPHGCPMKLVDGDFIFPNGGSLYIPSTWLHNGWGREVSLHVVGADTKSLPDKMSITFYSYLEDKFYQGTFPLPHARIADLFAEGYTWHTVKGPDQHITYNAIVAGVAPGGAVAVWVSGIAKEVEVFFGQAQEVKLDWHGSMGAPASVDREESRLRNIAEAAQTDPLVPEMQKALPLGVWSVYRTRYRWQPIFENLKVPERIAGVYYLNGERDYIDLPLDAAGQEARRPVPGHIELVTAENGMPIVYAVTFDEHEMLSVFPRLGRADTSLELVFHYQPERNDTIVLVRSAHETVKLERVKIETFAVG